MSVWLIALGCGLVAGFIGGVVGFNLALVSFVRGMKAVREREAADATRSVNP